MRRLAQPLAPDDLDLAERVLAGDEAAFEDFFGGHFPGLYRYSLARLRDPDAAREVVQTAICKAIANLGSYRGEAPLVGWLFTILRHEISACCRRLGRSPVAVEFREESPEVQDAASALPASPLKPDAALERKEVGQRVHAVLDLLPPRYSQALEWKYVDGVAVKEIARRLRLGPKAAESLLTRARQAFRDTFTRQTSRPGGTATPPGPLLAI